MSKLAKSQSLTALRDKVSKAIQDTFGTSGPNGKYTWVQDLFINKVVYTVDGQLYSVSYSNLDGKITFGTPVAVEVSYTPLGEAAREMCAEADRLEEGAYDAKTGELTVTIIRPGFNKSKGRFYPAAVLKRDYQIFEGAKMFADHQTDSESKQRPEGSVNNWVASVKKPWVEADGRVRAKAAVIDPPFKAKLEELNKQNLLHEMGVSIRAIGVASPADVQGTKTNLVESLVRARSVDFVTYAGAGGQVEAIEATHDENDVDLVTEAQLRERRPDLITLIESNSHMEGNVTLEQQLHEAQTALAAEKARADAAEGKIQESETKAKKAVAATELVKLLAESKLPEKGKERIRKQFAEATEVVGMKEAIEEEQDYIKAITPSGVRNMGSETQAQESSTEGNEKKANLEEAFALIPGLSKEEAKAAAGKK